MTWYQILLVYLLVLNFAGYFSMAIDKRRAKLDKWRIPERRLILVALLGGSIGSLVGMYKFRHKTKHPKFYIGVPAILIFQVQMVVIVLACLWKMNIL